MNKNSNVAVVTLHVLVNTDDMDETVKQLNERVTTHECVIDISVIKKPIYGFIVESVENGTYKEGTLKEFPVFN